MAHDPTRHWPLGVGPENTSIPGAAWLELLDGQAFPVVGAGAMVWNGTMWVPVSAQNRLPVEATLSGSMPEVVIEASTQVAHPNNALGKGGFGTSLGGAVPIDIRRYARLGLFVVNGMDATVTLVNYFAYRTLEALSESPYNNRFIIATNISVAAGASRWITIEDVKEMQKDLYPHVGSVWQFDTSRSTAGILRVVVMGVV